MNAPRDHIFDHTSESLRQWCERRGMAGYRAQQILDWVYAKGVADPARMTNLSRADRETLAREMTFASGRSVGHQLATDGTQKLLIQWSSAFPHPLEERSGQRDSNPPLPLGEGLGERDSASLPILNNHAATTPDPSRQTECVMIPTDRRRTACVSSQIGCPVGCRFCASGLGGLDANLSAGRIVEQVWLLDRLLAESNGAPDARRDSSRRGITHVVFMGMGEPLANFDNVRRAIQTLAALWGMNISARRITVSTVGLPKYIRRLAEGLDLPVTLALSLHAPTDQIRRELIPWSNYTSVADLIDACRAWFDKTGREITLEYTLLRGVNDRPEHARELARLAKTIRANVNLIRYNEVGGLEFKRPRSDDVHQFQRILREGGVTAHIRASRGRDIAAACGQLRHEQAQESV